jgi:hypothetical protein
MGEDDGAFRRVGDAQRGLELSGRTLDPQRSRFAHDGIVAIPMATLA